MLRPDELALKHLRERELTCSELGEIIWGRPTRNPQSYARPAGALLKRLEKVGLVKWRRDWRGAKVWFATRRGAK